MYLFGEPRVVSVLSGILYYAPNFGNESAFHKISTRNFCKKQLNITYMCFFFVRKSRAHANSVVHNELISCFVSQIELQVVRSCLY